MLGLEFGVETEQECAQLCWDAEECNFYSFCSLESSPLQLACAKLSKCNDRTANPSVLSGPSDCTDLDLVVESYPSCFKPQITWAHGSSETVLNIPSVEVCQEHCLNSSSCVSFTWHKNSPDLESMICELFPSIGNPTPCLDCISGPQSCTCSNNVTCSFHKPYLIDLVREVVTEEQCQDLCTKTAQCSWYTWQSSQAWPLGNTCSLLTKCADMREVVDGSVVSGFGDCTKQLIYPEPCSNYAILDSFSRNVNIPYGVQPGLCGTSAGYC